MMDERGEHKSKGKAMEKTVLIIDDEMSSLNLLSHAMRQKGFKVKTARDGLKGLIIARESNPDLILLDIMLPILDGCQVCRLLKFDSRYKHLPILMVTAKEEDREKGEQAGCDGFIVKPIDEHILIENMEKILA